MAEYLKRPAEKFQLSLDKTKNNIHKQSMKYHLMSLKF